MFPNYRFFLCSILVSLSLVTCSEDSPKKEVDTGSDDLLEQTEASFEKFKRDIDLYFSDLDQTAEKEKNNAYGRSLKKDKEQLKQDIREANVIFLDLRRKFRDIIFSMYGNHPATNLEAIAAEAGSTAWYIAHMKALLCLEACHEDEAQ